ncbi:undecaprenyl-diphosphate phosphatase [Holdemania massiliensis]|uniref:Undecaprenyl-diphosphatase n=1 Tax=Holdemania massiliensis TaxID=1468449 RepID=A0A6N7SB23_9FIRM|nr:undecaprenyl-diphosphate phosphatase [Holdemania massiliensis]MSA72828.1 undecaprenyl-diphosphate phosphatase [Holdemania massiliensis]MSA91093.1 undecaprenyl-diphosphate phosphatase [Holdemania massiliensis]MSB79943.1 undecaprenyl-diphosphate phosphatase [Holdemania massiliensis]MSC34864.1 undecaprenyl-diphosphate phosphatase [Holdemania massiliensis]MSC41253.1 undecaprenyl-diphosphate phosphatase [Holdemania massiliensis]
MIEMIKAIVLGIVQGITEWLPISSTGHMILVNELMPLTVLADVAANKEFVDMFMVVIQFGSILAVLLLYFHKLNPFSPRKNAYEKRSTIDLWLKVIVAVVPAGIIGVLFDDLIDAYFYNPITVAAMLIVYGVAFLVIENRHRRPSVTSFDKMSYKTALAIGVFQVLALIPGTSRSGATILGAVLLGCSRGIAAEFSFFLAVPVMFGASLLKLIKMKIAFSLATASVLLVGMIVAFIVSVFAIRFLMGYIRKHDFKAFGVYRIVLGVLVLAYFFLIK